ncbi:hypothetical protein [Permianibacter aggregans]|uniref:Uncharacterized protein n=1 Tax=Permianibacter aggregans TaxID=1510150 RepID=A0A4R6UUG3_9GAMM|nr:hypothetical protein [Permianibacter aggregans]QGX39763.1 hypothetical protein E2H98_08880 [Permianibacter aggregans]TDQ47114.1 hypothetical protein EV696_11142 [Permianibacter aggregans]
MNKSLVVLAASALLSASAHAVPWCWGGTIVNNYASKSFSPTELYAVETQMINIADPGYAMAIDKPVYVASHAAWNHGQMYAGGAGPNWNNVPGHGQIRTRITAPYTLTNMVGPGAYFLSQGMSAKYDKCFGGPIPMREERSVVEEVR